MDLDLVEYEPESPMEGSLFSMPNITRVLSSVEGFNLLPGWSFHPLLYFSLRSIIHVIEHLEEVVVSTTCLYFLTGISSIVRPSIRFYHLSPIQDHVSEGKKLWEEYYSMCKGVVSSLFGGHLSNIFRSQIIPSCEVG